MPTNIRTILLSTYIRCYCHRRRHVRSEDGQLPATLNSLNFLNIRYFVLYSLYYKLIWCTLHFSYYSLIMNHYTVTYYHFNIILCTRIRGINV